MSTEILNKTRNQTIYDLFRRWGYLEAALDPLGRLSPVKHPELAIETEEAAEARRLYCGSIGVEFMHIPDPEPRAWVQDRMEEAPPDLNRESILHQLIKADLFEQVLQSRYLGNKRFSIQGVDALVPLLIEMLHEAAATQDLQRTILAMSHRGRLNVIYQVVGRPAYELFVGFEDTDPKSTLGGGDVKYHLGATGTFQSREGKEVAVHLVSNPSHLEAVDPVAMGRVRARQTRKGDGGQNKVLPIVMHGDAAFAGQGILAEVLNLATLPGFSVGGTIHVIVNNLIGFTAVPEELHSSRFASDVAKRLPIPIFHVNAEDPDAVVRVGKMAVDYRYQFQSDVVVDLIGYRRYGHSEIDDPTITQPLLYKKIAERPPVWKRYGNEVGIDTDDIENEIRDALEKELEKAKSMEQRPVMRELPSYWSTYRGGRYDPGCEVDTGVERKELSRLGSRLVDVPEDFNVHNKVKRLLEQRREMAQGERPLDFGMAEALAFASLVEEGYYVRLTGQDSRRGTFNQRHSYLVDVENGEEYCPLGHISEKAAPFECHDSMLSEAAVLGFEYGFSRDYPDGLILWEAQFGDFANGAQVIIDQFVTAGEDKWDLLSGLVMLLPHGYEGQGPEHSSARIERFLQLAGEDNIQVCQPSTAAQYFHLLRRQALRKWRKPLVVFTPKSMLRHPSAMSDLVELTAARFRPVIGDEDILEAKRIIVCTGKIGHELKKERANRNDEKTAIIFLEQLYPFPESDLREAVKTHPGAEELIWVQEEPANMGALFYVFPKLERLAGDRSVRSIKRSPSASPATGSARAHELEQKTLLNLAFL